MTSSFTHQQEGHPVRTVQSIPKSTHVCVFPPSRLESPPRPQYIYGPLTNKRDYLDWFFDRVVHGLEFIPLPLHGDQLVALTHAEDVASMLASVVGNELAVNQVKSERALGARSC